jgi:hypothetical protein
MRFRGGINYNAAAQTSKSKYKLSIEHSFVMRINIFCQQKMRHNLHGIIPAVNTTVLQP